MIKWQNIELQLYAFTTCNIQVVLYTTKVHGHIWLNINELNVTWQTKTSLNTNV